MENAAVSTLIGALVPFQHAYMSVFVLVDACTCTCRHMYRNLQTCVLVLVDTCTCTCRHVYLLYWYPQELVPCVLVDTCTCCTCRHVYVEQRQLQNPHRNILDGDLLWRFLYLSHSERGELAKRIGTSNDQVTTPGGSPVLLWRPGLHGVFQPSIPDR